MAITLNPSRYTQEQIKAATPILASIEKYERMIAQEKICANIVNEPFEDAKFRRNRLMNYETQKRELCHHLEKILNARNTYDEKFKAAEEAIEELAAIKDRWGF